MKGKVGLAALFAIGLSSHAWAEPSLQSHAVKGSDHALVFEWEVSYVQVSGLERGVQSKLNTALEEELGFAPLAGMRAMLQTEGGEFSDPDQPNGVWVGMSGAFVGERLLAVDVSESTYWSGAAHPNTALSAAVFDLTTGERIPSRSLFAAGDDVMARVIGKVNQALRDEYTFEGEYLLDEVTPENLGAILPTREGIHVLWGSYGLGAPYAMGPPTAVLPYAQLAGLLNTELLGDAARPTLDMGLGEDAQGQAAWEDDFGGDDWGDAEAIDPVGAYLRLLGEDAEAVFSGIDVEERRTLRAHGLVEDADGWSSAQAEPTWGWANSPDALIDTLGKLGLGNVADGVRDVLATTRRIDPLFEAIDFGDSQVRMREATTLEAALNAALADYETGRVVTMGNALLVRGEDPEGFGQAFAKLPHGAVVGVIQRAQGWDLFHRVRLGNGQVGHVHKSYLLIETPKDQIGAVYRRADGSYAFGSADGVPLIAKDGPGHTDAELEALTALVGPNGVSPLVRLTAIQRERAFLDTWYAVVDFEPVALDPAALAGPAAGTAGAGKAAASAAAGIEDALKQQR